jgi:hypothetical protein
MILIWSTSQLVIGSLLLIFAGKEKEHILIREYFAVASIGYALSLLQNMPKRLKLAPFRILTLSIMTFSITKLSIITLSI